MVVEDGGQGPLQQLRVELPHRVEHEDVGVVRLVGEVPLLECQVRRYGRDDALVGRLSGPGGRRGGDRGQPGNCRVGDELGRRDRDTRLASPVDDPDQVQRVTPELEEVIVPADLSYPQHLPPDAGQPLDHRVVGFRHRFLQRSRRLCRSRGAGPGHASSQPGPVDLAVGQVGQRVDQHHRGHHVPGQPLPQGRA